MKHGLLPAAFIDMIGVVEKRQNNGLGSAFVADALDRIALASVENGTCVVIPDVFGDGD